MAIIRIEDIPESLHRKIKSQAALAGETVPTFCLDLLEQALERGIGDGEMAAFLEMAKAKNAKAKKTKKARKKPKAPVLTHDTATPDILDGLTEEYPPAKDENPFVDLSTEVK